MIGKQVFLPKGLDFLVCKVYNNLRIIMYTNLLSALFPHNAYYVDFFIA